MAAIPKRASTIILVRKKGVGGFEVFLVKRREKSRFMAGNFVFPGGMVDPLDAVAETLRLTRGLTSGDAGRLLNGAPDDALGHLVAGIRELFEEAGILLACNADGDLVRPDGTRDLQELRQALRDGSVAFAQLLERERLFLALDKLLYYAHWITPEFRPLRFDARYFVAVHPDGQEATPDNDEVTEGRWIEPAAAFHENLQGSMVISPPVLTTIEDLAAYRSLEELLAGPGQREAGPILPILAVIRGEESNVLPWDPDYERFRQGEIDDAMDHGRICGLGDGMTRLVLQDGRWLPYRKEG
jgi:8-oxo-dGTP pyrophosphatase MutT (NUDIX family)